MTPRRLLPLLLVVVGGCATIAGDCDGPGEKGAKTLFEWAPGKKECAEEKKNGNKENGNGEKGQKDDAAKEGRKEEEQKEANGNKGEANGNGNGEEEEEGPGPIETDRPDFTEASSTVGRRRIQLESGYTYVSDRENGTRVRSHSAPEALLRVGLFADWFELRLGQNFSSTRTTGPADSGDGDAEGPLREDGPEDLYLGVKLALTEQKGCLPEMALILQTTVPTGSDDLTASQLLPGINFLFGWDVVEDCLSVGGSLQANRSLDDSGHYYVEVAQSLTIGYRLVPRVGAYTEWFAFYPTSALDPGTGPEHFFNGGFTFLVNDDFQLDVRAGLGLNDHADDFFTGAGFAVRF